MSKNLSVLLVPDFIDWILGTWAKQICKIGATHDYYLFPSGLISHDQKKWKYLINHVDVIHLLNPHVRKLLPELQGKVVISSIHHVIDWEKIAPLTQTDAVMVVSQEWKEYLLEKNISENKIFVFNNGVDISKFQPLQNKKEVRRKLRINSELFLLGFSAKFTSNACDRKGVQIFLQAIKEVNKKNRLAIVITGPGWEDAIEELTECGIETYYYPFLPERLMPTFYNSLDAYIVTAKIEGGPVPLLESIACGTPIITTPVGIAKDFIQHNINGIVTPKDNVQATSQAILELMHSDELRVCLANSGLHTVRSSLTWDKTLAGIENLYTHIWETSSSGKNCTEKIELDPEKQRNWATTVDSYRWHEKLLFQGYWQEGLIGIIKHIYQGRGRHIWSILKASFLAKKINRIPAIYASIQSRYLSKINNKVKL